MHPYLIPALLATLFVISGVAKLIHSSDFKVVLATYNLLPKKVIGFFTYFLPIVELALAVLLLIPKKPITFYAMIGATLLLFIFTGAVYINIVRGNPIPCGCFKPQSKKSANLWTVIRNGLLIFACTTYIVKDAFVEIPATFLFIAVLGFFLLPAMIVVKLASKKMLNFVTQPRTTIAEKDYSQYQYTITRRDFLRLAISGILGVFLMPAITNVDASTCWRWQYYDHFDPQCCDWWTWSLHHHYRRCCNICTGQLGYWQMWKSTTCDTCGCNDRCDRIYDCIQLAAACQAQ